MFALCFFVIGGMQSMVSSYNLIACAFLRILFGIQVESVDDLTVLVTIGIVHLYPENGRVIVRASVLLLAFNPMVVTAGVVWFS